MTGFWGEQRRWLAPAAWFGCTRVFGTDPAALPLLGLNFCRWLLNPLLCVTSFF